MQDAENYARWIDAQNELLKQQAQRSQKSAAIGFSFGGVSFGVGTPLVILGIRTDNRAILISGAGVIVGTGIVWVAGHYLFNWW
jgi:alpha/beta superfamily hydrolase